MSATIDRSQPIAVTLTAEQWEMVLRMLDEVPAPHRVSDPLIRSIYQQCMPRHAEPSLLELPKGSEAGRRDERMRGNGEVIVDRPEA
jgi:hypothetical protein